MSESNEPRMHPNLDIIDDSGLLTELSRLLNQPLIPEIIPEPTLSSFEHKTSTFDLARVSKTPHPLGLNQWQETSVGQTLIETCTEMLVEELLTISLIRLILNMFDQIMTEQMNHTRSHLHFKITSGTILQYKNLDGSWVIYVHDFIVEQKHSMILSSPIIRIVATETPILDNLLNNKIAAISCTEKEDIRMR